MLRSVLAVITGFILWSILWLVYNVILKKAAILPADTTRPFNDTKPLILLIIGSCVISAIAGYITTVIAKSGTNAAVGLGLLLIAAGIFFQSQVWHLLPLWYHCAFLILLFPLCFAGARLGQP